MFKKIISATLVVASIGGISYGAWYGLGKWGYAKATDAYIKVYAQREPILAPIMQDFKDIPVNMKGFPFSWSFQLDTTQSEKIKFLFSQSMKKVIQNKYGALGEHEAVFDKFVEKMNIDEGEFNVSWRSLLDPHPFQVKTRFSFAPDQSFTVHFQSDTQGDSKKIGQENIAIDLVKEGQTLSTSNANITMHESHMDIDFKGNIDQKLGEEIKNAYPHVHLLIELAINHCLPFDIAITARAAWTNSGQKSDTNAALPPMLSQGPLTTEGDCRMTFKDKTLTCHFDVFLDGYNKEKSSFEKIKLQVALPKKEVTELFQKMGIPHFYGPFVIEKEDQLIFKFEKDGEKQILNDKPTTEQPADELPTNEQPVTEQPANS